MNFRDLEYALALERLGHFSRAAEACDVSQPTLSGQIRKFEDELGVTIFERDGRTLRVTPVGRTILDLARRAVGAVDEIRRAADAGRDPLIGALRVGIIPTLAPYLLPYVLPLARRRSPAMPLTVVEEQTETLTERIAAGEVDVALLATAPAGPGFVDAPIFDEPLLLAMATSHPLAKKSEVDARDLQGETVLVLAGGHCLREQTLALCSRAQTALSNGNDLRATNLETLLNLVEAGYGVTVVPALALRAGRLSDARLTTRPFADAHVARRVRLVYRRFAPRLRAFDSLAATIRDSLPRNARDWARGLN